VKVLRPLVPISLLLSAMACIPGQPQVVPEPRTGHVRVTSLECNSDPHCAAPTQGRVYEGPVVRLDSNRLDVFDLDSQTRFTVLADQQALVAVYRGQRHGADVVAKGAGRGALFGAGAGLFTALVLKVAYGSKVDFEEAARGSVTAGVIAGGINGAGQAIARGEPAWERISIRVLYEERRASPRRP
jgi:hypothetical protein